MTRPSRLRPLALALLLSAAPMAVVAADMPPEAAELMVPLPLSPTGQPVVGFPDGAPASPAASLTFTADELAKLKAGSFTAGIAMQAMDSPWNTLQVEALKKTLDEYGIKVVAVTDAKQAPTAQADQLEGMIAQKVNLIFSVPIDPKGQADTYKRVSESGVKIVFMDNVAYGMAPGKDYVTVVASDNEQNAVFATDEMIKAIGGKGEVGLMTYIQESYYSIAARVAGFEKSVAAHPGVTVAAREKFTQPREAYDKAVAMLTAHPDIKGIFAVWGDPAMQTLAGAESLGRNDLVVTTNDLGPDSALYIARDQIIAIGAQLPYDLGIAEAQAGAAALLGKPVPPYISLPSLRVKKANLLSALKQVTKQDVPEDVVKACAGACY
ncbi:substrate-binding domain-containing protein [Mesorhizobium loti]|nr:substrate-binding domain-containing protein [Mesorhizobium loti]